LQAHRQSPLNLVERLDGLEKKANHLKASIAYESMMDLLRNRITVVRDRLKAE
jgi:hypothetical protein